MEWEPSFEFDNLVFTPSDAGYPFPSPSSDLPPHVQPSHMNLDQLQSQLGDVLPSVAAMEVEPSLDVENIISTTTDVVGPSSDLPPVQSSIDPRQSAVAAAIESWEPPDLLSSTPTDAELLEKYLLPVVQPSGFPMESELQLALRWQTSCTIGFASRPAAVVNAVLPSMNPWELRGIMAGKQGSREKCYLTDHHALCLTSKGQKVETRDGFWIKRDVFSLVYSSSRGLKGLFGQCVGIRRTYIWNDMGGNKSNWIMNVYSELRGPYAQDDLVLCHVFEASPDYHAKLKHPSFSETGGRCFGLCGGEHCHDGFCSLNRAIFNSIPRERYQIRDPKLTSYMTMLEGVLFGGPDPHSSMETENSNPRSGVSPTNDHGQSDDHTKKSSDVWDYFTKIHARDLEGNVLTLAICNHCSRALAGSSAGGTSHLARHTCPCKFKPVQAGRMGKG